MPPAAALVPSVTPQAAWAPGLASRLGRWPKEPEAFPSREHPSTMTHTESLSLRARVPGGETSFPWHRDGHTGGGGGGLLYTAPHWLNYSEHRYSKSPHLKQSDNQQQHKPTSKEDILTGNFFLMFIYF